MPFAPPEQLEIRVASIRELPSMITLLQPALISFTFIRSSASGLLHHARKRRIKLVDQAARIGNAACGDRPRESSDLPKLHAVDPSAEIASSKSAMFGLFNKPPQDQRPEDLIPVDLARKARMGSAQAYSLLPQEQHDVREMPTDSRHELRAPGSARHDNRCVFAARLKRVSAQQLRCKVTGTQKRKRSSLAARRIASACDGFVVSSDIAHQ